MDFAQSQNIQQNICDAVNIIVEQAIKRAGYDRTVEAIIVKLDNADTNQYTILYQGVNLIAYGTSGMAYAQGARVFVMLPGSDPSNRRIILGAAAEGGEESVILEILERLQELEEIVDPIPTSIEIINNALRQANIEINNLDTRVTKLEEGGVVIQFATDEDILNLFKE